MLLVHMVVEKESEKNMGVLCIHVKKRKTVT